MMKAAILLFCVFQIALGNRCPDNLPSSCFCEPYGAGGDEDVGETVMDCVNLDQNTFEALCTNISGLKFNELSFRHSTFTRLHAFAFKNVSILRLTIENATISDVDPDAFSQIPYLQIVNIRQSLMTKLPKFKDIASTLKEMAITNNKISQVAANEFSDLVNLKEVNLNDNGITDIEDGAFHNLKVLKDLYVDRNQISKIGNWFDANDKLEFLSIEGNNLNEFPDNLFTELPNLLGLDASRNKITTIKKSLFQGFLAKDYSELDLEGNNIVCDNKLCWLYQYYQAIDEPNIHGTCAGPETIKGKKIYEVDGPKEAGCDY